MRIMVTGNLGYVGSVLLRTLSDAYPDAYTSGLDTGFFRQYIIGRSVELKELPKVQQFKDIRDVTLNDLVGKDAVVHLAAVSNDPIGNMFENVTAEVNRDASVNLIKLAIRAGVRNFVFASSCSMYGQSDDGPRREIDKLNPLTAYARSKVAVEEDVKNIDLRSMVFTSLRFATACGWSTRLRLDLVLNDFVASALTSRKIDVLSDGSPWRPLIDVEDMCRAVHWAIVRTASSGGQYLTINVGTDENNYSVREIAEAVSHEIPKTTIKINPEAPKDNRSYKVDFSLYKKLAPEHLPKVSLSDSIRRLADALTCSGFSDPNFRNSPLVRLNALKLHIEAGRLNKNLRWIT